MRKHCRPQFTRIHNILSSKEEEMEVCVYFSTLDYMISRINVIFNQDTMNLIRINENLFVLNVNSNDISVLSSEFDLI